MKEREKEKKTWYNPLLLVLVVGIIAGCALMFHKSHPRVTPPVTTERGDAELILKNLAIGMRMYSTAIGGGGEKAFTDDLMKIQRYVMQDAFAACQGKAYRGLLVELNEYPSGDAFKTNFRFVAKPTDGYTGQVYAIDKTEEIFLLNEQEK